MELAVLAGPFALDQVLLRLLGAKSTPVPLSRITFASHCLQ
jgi:hypothetical protein